jgi:RNA polymerase sigma-70 factor (ECF subfamily)
MDDKALIAAAQQGDTTAFNRLILQYQDLAYTVAYRIMSDRDAAADAAQEAFISAHKGLSRFRGGSFRAWLMRIVTNACYDELRRRKRRPQSPLESLYGDEQMPSSSHSSPPESPEQHVERQELGRLLQDGISRLSDDQRLALVLSDVQGFSYQEIADILGVPRGTVKSRLHRARSRLRDYLQDREELLPLRYRLANRASIQA